MKIGCNALYPGGNYSRRDCFDLAAYGEALANLGRAGFATVEYSHSYHFSLGQAVALREVACRAGLECWSCHAEGPDEFSLAGDREEARQALFHCLDLCAALGGQVVVLHTPCGGGDLAVSGGTAMDAGLESDRRILEPSCAHAQRLGLEIALENGLTRQHMGYIMRLRDLIGAENLGFCVDTGHAALGDLGPVQAIRLAASHLYTTHLQDNLGREDDHLPPGLGRIDWTAVFAALHEVRYQRTLMLALTDRPGGREYNQQLELAQGARNVRAFADIALA
jgi:sugar phosphate isomerase/epimerase